MLIYAPNTPRLQLELGVLYYRIGAYDVAVTISSILDARLETRWRDFEDNSNLPTNSLRTGAQTRFGATYSYYLTPALVLTTQGYAQREDAKAGF